MLSILRHKNAVVSRSKREMIGQACELRPCYTAQFLQQLVALQVAEELRGVTGYLGNLQRIIFCCAQRCTK